jgi:hypothetical protein
VRKRNKLKIMRERNKLKKLNLNRGEASTNVNFRSPKILQDKTMWIVSQPNQLCLLILAFPLSKGSLTLLPFLLPFLLSLSSKNRYIEAYTYEEPYEHFHPKDVYLIEAEKIIHEGQAICDWSACSALCTNSSIYSSLLSLKRDRPYEGFLSFFFIAWLGLSCLACLCFLSVPSTKMSGYFISPAIHTSNKDQQRQTCWMWG